MNWHCCEATAEEETKNYLKIILQIKTDKKSLHGNLYSYHNAAKQHISQEGKKLKKENKNTHPQTNTA